MDKVLKRTMFETSRVLEYFTERELSYQTGHSRDIWPQVVLKELMDNALDACENASIPPEIKVGLHNKEHFFSISVEDNGPGINPGVISKILNFQTRTSDKEAYVSPTRGAQGNALKTVFAIPYVLSTSTPQEGVCLVESKGIQHTIKIKLDAVKQEPRIEHGQAKIVKKPGCRVTVRLENTGIPGGFPKELFLQILWEYHLFNPHLSLAIKTNFMEEGFGEDHHDYIERSYGTTNSAWQKWKPSDFTSPLWYSDGDLKKLILSHVALAEDGNRDLTLREFVSQFRGLTSTAKQKQVTSAFPNIKHLSDFVSNGDALSSLIEALLIHMKGITKPVPPHHLGIIGEEHFKQAFEGKDIKYIKKTGSNDGIPFIVEVVYVPDNTLEEVKFHFGLNFAPSSEDPLQGYRLEYETQKECFEGHGIRGLANRYKVDYRDKVHIVCHMAYPRFRFKDRGKSILEVK